MVFFGGVIGGTNSSSERAFDVARRSSSAGNGVFIVERAIVKGKYAIRVL
jgi:hypothetical protein